MLACVGDPYDVIVIGGGAAGLSAALVLGRACRSALVCDDGRPRNIVADRMHGFLSRDGTPPKDLLEIARGELSCYPSVQYLSTHIASAQRGEEYFTVVSDDGAAFEARRLLLATGVYDALPQIPGLRERWGSSVFVCPYCDGWEVRGKRLAVIGKGRKAVELAQELHRWSGDLIVCTQDVDDLNDADRRWLAAANVSVRKASVTSIDGKSASEQEIWLGDGSAVPCDAVFLCAPLRQRYPLVDMLGIRVRSDGEIDVDERGRTSVPGCYAAGDAVTTIHQVVLAAASGVCAAMGINDELLAEEVRALAGKMPP
jgi:thioredoxin reductase